MSILERHQSALLNPSLTPFFTSSKKLKVFHDNTSEYLNQIRKELCQSIPIMLTFVDFKNLKLFLFAFYTKATKGQCDPEIPQKNYPFEEELYEDPVFLSFHGSQLLIVIIIFIIFATIVFFAKKKSKKHVLKLRSETCSALNKLGSVSLDKELTKTTKQSKKMQTVFEEV